MQVENTPENNVFQTPVRPELIRSAALFTRSPSPERLNEATPSPDYYETDMEEATQVCKCISCGWDGKDCTNCPLHCPFLQIIPGTPSSCMSPATVPEMRAQRSLVCDESEEVEFPNIETLPVSQDIGCGDWCEYQHRNPRCNYYQRTRTGPYEELPNPSAPKLTDAQPDIFESIDFTSLPTHGILKPKKSRKRKVISTTDLYPNLDEFIRQGKSRSMLTNIRQLQHLLMHNTMSLKSIADISGCGEFCALPVDDQYAEILHDLYTSAMYDQKKIGELLLKVVL